MTGESSTQTALLTAIVDQLDIPITLYAKAAARHHALGEWVGRSASRLARFDPIVRPQGSFRYGTVIPPLHATDEYDLDNVCVLRALNASMISQKDLKKMYGEELRDYAIAHQMIAPLEEHNRCWRLRYADEVAFHLDSLPCLPGDPGAVSQLAHGGVAEDFALPAVVITDRTHPEYATISHNWLLSNPRGFARWFESRAALGRDRGLMEKAARASVEDVPPYEWKTTLQRGIQILKRHRDVMFVDRPALAPISMIITNLAAHAYQGETDLATALVNMVDRMLSFVRAGRPRVPNPAGPAEDYADKWARDPRLEQNFLLWHAQVRRDLSALVTTVRTGQLSEQVDKLFRVSLAKSAVRRIEEIAAVGSSGTIRVAPALAIPTAPKPWGSSGRFYAR